MIRRGGGEDSVDEVMRMPWVIIRRRRRRRRTGLKRIRWMRSMVIMTMEIIMKRRRK
jgi:hypothetical protein